MHSRRYTLLLWGLFCSAAFAQLRCLTANEPELDEPEHTVQMEVFYRSDKPSAADVRKYADELSQNVKGLEVILRDVLEPQQLERFYDLSKRVGQSKPVVPAFRCCGRMHFGFSSAATSGSAIKDLFTADVYTRKTCPHCIEAKQFMEELKPRWPAIVFRIHEITEDAIARQRWESLCRGAGAVPGLPTIDFAGHVIIGYQGHSVTGKQLEELIERKSRAEEKDKAKAIPNPRSNSSWMPSVFPKWFVALQFQLLHLGMDLPIEYGRGPPTLELPDEASDSQAPEATLAETNSLAPPEKDTIDVPIFGELRVNELGLTLFSFLVGLVDGFNPCAMWVLVFLLSVLVNIRDRRKIILIAGTFVFVSGLAYFAFMAAWLNLFLLIGIARPVQVGLGCLAILIGSVNIKDFFAFKQGVTLSIPESRKPGLYRRVRSIVEAKYLAVAIGSAVALAIFVNMIELLCTAGLPAVYTQILTLHKLPLWQNYLYLAVYIIAYMLDDTILMVVVVATLSHRKLQEREGRWLKLISGLVVLALGVLMLFKPEWLQLGR